MVHIILNCAAGGESMYKDSWNSVMELIANLNCDPKITYCRKNQIPHHRQLYVDAHIVGKMTLNVYLGRNHRKPQTAV